MLYDEKYRNIPIMSLGDDCYLHCAEAQPCCVCGRLTHFCEINYEGYFCSDECEAQFAQGLSSAPYAEWPVDGFPLTGGPGDD